MTLKTACKTAITLSIVSFVLIVIGHVFSALMILGHPANSGNGWQIALSSTNMSIFLSQLMHSLFYLLSPVLLIAGLITLLSGCLKQQHNPNANVKTRHIIAAVLFGLAALVVAIQAATFIWTTLRHAPHLNFSYVLSFTWHGVTLLCSITLCIFAVANAVKSISHGPATAAIICHLLHAVAMIASVGHTIYYVLSFNSGEQFGKMFIIFWFTSSVFSHTGTFLWLAAVLLFLFAWLKQNPLPTEARVIDPAPEPIPTLSAEQLRPEA